MLELSRFGIEEGRLNWEALLSTFKEVKSLKKIPQDTIHHGEGNVLIHTQMMCEALLKLEEFKSLGLEDKKIVFFAAFFHDLGKGITTKEEGGRIVSPKHALKGEVLVRELIYKKWGKAFNFKERETICKLIRYHGLPLFFWNKPQPEKYIIEASQMVKLSDLVLIAEADCRGRVCGDLDKLLDAIELFKNTAKEQECLNKPKAFSNGLSRFEYFNKKERALEYTAYEKENFKVMLLSGLPAAGKDTWIKTHGEGLEVITLDEIRTSLKIAPTDEQGKVAQYAKEQAKAYLREKKSFIWNATNTTKEMRARLVKLFMSYEANVEIIYIETPYEVLLKRSGKRERNVPRKVIDKLLKNLEIPSPIEAPKVSYYIE
ncbi:AAA family ATPase [Cellulosilyticum sp. I15G10I2]|uniref:AAA family ATPase n=1 Tax=Cellulosilyticum sp. I15G10I2 TaxID=1892843 RepID=UPI00085BF548|nr:AAA family ATPase [Cellulosilyticum sp. I15G10I2]